MNFIIYEDAKEYSTKYKNVIHKLLGPTTLNYKIIEINEYNDKAKKELGWVATRNLDDMCASLWKWQTMNPDGFATKK